MCAGGGGKGVCDGLRVGVVRWPISGLLHGFLKLRWRALRTFKFYSKTLQIPIFLVFGFFFCNKEKWDLIAKVWMCFILFYFWKHFKLNVSLHQDIFFQCLLLFAQSFFCLFVF